MNINIALMNIIMEEETIKHLYAIIKKPQAGKTFICLENIKCEPNALHLIITMNTIKSNLQFFERACEKFPDKICVFNSKKDDETSLQICHARTVLGVRKKIDDPTQINIVILCAHSKRFQTSILDLINLLNDSKSFTRNIIIHIDEAHAYIPSYRDKIVEMNNYDICERIYLYSASPFNIWADHHERQHAIYKHIYVVDVEQQFGIVNSEKYFGVKDCTHVIEPFTDGDELIAETIPRDFIDMWGSEHQRKITTELCWYGSKFPFTIGNEHVFLSHIRKMLTNMEHKTISNDTFSYNFIPAYMRKLTHYFVMDIILKIFTNALVVIINGDGTKFFINNLVTNKPEEHQTPRNNEISKSIQKIITMYPDRPTFITGFHCVGMSVTLINEDIGNFDNVIFSHEQYVNQPEILYQLCRFLFNYISWKSHETIQQTRLYVSDRAVLETCINYEKQIELIENTMVGSIRVKDEVVGDVKVKRVQKPIERKFDALESYATVPPLKRFIVYDGNDDEQKTKMIQYCEDWVGRSMEARSIPEKNPDGFYECAPSNIKRVHENPTAMKQWCEKSKWYTNHKLTPTQFKYYRIYVAYDSLDDTTEYTWIVRLLEIKNTPAVQAVWSQIST